MQIMIAMTENPSGRFYTLSTEKAAMSVSVMRTWVSVCSHTSTAAINRNLGGRVFHGANALSAAIAAYKSSASKAMLEAVQHAEQDAAAAKSE